MLRFHVNEKPDIKMIEVKKRVAPLYVAQINEPFSVGTQNGVAHGKTGDYLLSNEYGLSVVKEAAFDILYEPTRLILTNLPKEEKKEDKVEKPVAKKSIKEIYQKPKEVKKVVKKAVKPIVKKPAKPATKKAPKKVAKKKKK